MKRYFIILLALLAVAATSPLVPTLPKAKKKPLLSPKAQSLVTTRMKLAAVVPPQPPLPNNRVVAMWFETDGSNVISSTSVTGIVFSVSNPKKDHYVISAAPDLTSTWQVIASGRGMDPIKLYDFTSQNQAQQFYKIAIDDSGR